MNFYTTKKIVNKFRFLLARYKLKTVRYYCGDLPAFYSDMDAHGFEYVVLRWADKVPLNSEAERLYHGDVDHLIANDIVGNLAKVSAQHGGTVKCDWYSVTGQSGSGFLAMPYYMPVLARQILDTRWRDPRGFYRPAPKQEFLAFVFHLCYHKGHRCGIKTGFAVAHNPNPKSDYLAEALRLATVADIPMENNVSLLGLHNMLKQHYWNMPLDLLLRWPDQHPFLRELLIREELLIKNDSDRVKNLTVFILREDCDSESLENIVRKGIQGRFEVLSEFALDETQCMRVMSQTRGGNWFEKGRNGTVAPTRAFICRNAQTPGQLPIMMTKSKLKSRYPHIVNTDVLIKRVIRRDVVAAAGDGVGRVVLHATDNPTEAAETLHAILGDKFDDILCSLGF